jgi:hypothetical protein
VLCPKSPDLVLQEIWGHLCRHYADRTLMLDAATAGGHDRRPDVLRRRPADHPQITVAQRIFPPHDRNAAATLWHCAIGKLLGRTNPARRPRSNPRAVKRKILKWAAKRAHHQHYPQPTCTAEYTIQAP